MKKEKLFICLIFFILVLSLVCSLEIKSKDSFSKGETFLAELSGNILQNINTENVGFYKSDHILLPLEFDIIKFNNTFFIYSILPYVEQNYTLKIKDVIFKEDNIVKTQTIEKKFVVDNSTAEFNINPGFIVSKTDFIIKIHNNLNDDLTINYDLSGEVLGTVYVKAQSDKEEIVSIEDVDSTKITSLKLIGLSTIYNIPAYIIKNFTIQSNNTLNNSENESGENESDENESGGTFAEIGFTIRNLNATINKNQYFSSIQLFGKIDILNIGEDKTGIINLTVSDSLKDYVNLSSNKLDSIEPYESSKIEFSVFFPKKGVFSGEIIAKCNDSSDKIEINFIVGENVTINSSNPPISNNTKTCQQLGGVKCQNNYEICVGKPIAASDSFSCCDGQCKKIEDMNKPSERNWIVIIILLIILAIISAFLFFKYKKPSLTKNSLISKTESYEKSHETRGRITRV